MGRSEEGRKRLAPPRPQVAANAERLLEGAGPRGGACAHGHRPCPPATTLPGPAPGPRAYNPGCAPKPALLRRLLQPLVTR